jgi:hypothetical protein
MLRVGSIVIRVDDLPRQGAFWTTALDYVAHRRTPTTSSWRNLEGNRFCVMDGSES